MGCSYYDELTDPTINGTWHLMKYEHSTNGDNLFSVRSDFVWTFDEANKELTIEHGFFI